MKHPVLLFIVLALIMGLIAGFLSIQINSQQDYDEAVDAYMAQHTIIKLPTTIESIMKLLSGDTTDDLPETQPADANDIPQTNDIVIYVDAGHGGNSAAGPSLGTNVGATFGFNIMSPTGNYLTERENNYYIAEKVKSDLESHGYRVVMSRNEPNTQNAIGNKARGAQAAMCDGALIIHANVAGGPGFFWISQRGKSSEYNSTITSTYLDSMSATGGISVNTRMPNGCFEKNTSLVSEYLRTGGTLDRLLYVEVGACDEEADARYISSELGRTEIAKALSKAIRAGVTTKAHEPQNNDNTTNPTPGSNYPSWCVGLHGVDTNGAHAAYDYLKSKGIDDATMQSNWDALMNHYALHGTDGW